MVMAAALPERMPAPAEAMHAAPIRAIEAVCAGVVAPLPIMSAMVFAPRCP